MNSDSSIDSSAEKRDTEPADPKNVDHEKRRNTRIGLRPYRLVNRKPVTKCGCGGCPEVVDPLYDGTTDDIRADYYALEQCDSPRSMTVQEAKQAYLTYQHASYQSAQRTSAYERHRYGIYPRILNADRHFQSKHQWLTTVLFTRRLSPIGKNGQWIEPATLDAMLHNNRVMERVREASRYRLKKVKGLDYEYVRVTAPTESAATPHEHRYFWIDDPNNQVTVEDFRPILKEHLQNCAGAYEEDHPVDSNGDTGAIRIQHNPTLVDAELAQEGTRHTAGVQYLGSQLAHMPLGDKFDQSKADPLETLLEGGAIAWVTPSQWFGASNGVPKLDG